MQRKKRPKYGGRTRRRKQPTVRTFTFATTHEEAAAIVGEVKRLNCGSISEYLRRVAIPGDCSEESAIAS